MEKYKAQGLLPHVWESASRTDPRDFVFSLFIYVCFGRAAQHAVSQFLTGDRAVPPAVEGQMLNHQTQGSPSPMSLISWGSPSSVACSQGG